jgi:site-specific recombinase XerD
MHSLRHTFATRCIERGVSIKALQRIMGHANIATTLDIYVHVSDEFLQDAMQIFEMGDE